ncbi:MAG: hypothetical protein HY298_12435 [Verrucomicrobia bacterium]|nr:hypothetical protein [Verrucomicrobiota bacterium]
MKTLLNKLPKGRITRWGFLAVLLIAAGATVGWMNQRHYQLGGSWIGKGAGSVWTAVHAPLDPEAQTMAGHVNFQSYGPDTAGLIAAFGGDRMSEFVGETKMINRDTAKWTLVGYVQAGQNPPQIVAIIIGHGTWKYTDRDHAVLNYTIDTYPAAADADGDGMPDPGAIPVVTTPGVIDTAQRVPILP